MGSDIKTENKNWEEHGLFHLADSTYKENQLKILKLLRGIRSGNLLDIGCGNGSFTIECARVIGAKELCGIEIAEEKAKEAKSKGIEVLVRDASANFPFDDEYFEVIVANQVLEHVIDIDNMLRESKRVLKRDGVLVLSTPNLCSLLQRLLVFVGRQPTTLHVSEIQVGNFLKGVKASGHVHAFSPPALSDLVQYHGFKIERFVGVGFYPFGAGLARVLAKLSRNTSVYLIVKARKQT